MSDDSQIDWSKLVSFRPLRRPISPQLGLSDEEVAEDRGISRRVTAGWLADPQDSKPTR
jgi:hypothetical protein